MIEVHEAANIFPLDEESIPDLAEDIRKNGQQVPIERLGGKVIDGRRRLKACELAGVQPVFKDIATADPVDYVLSLNLHRRHLKAGDLAMVGSRAGKLREKYADEARERQKATLKRGKEIPVPEPVPERTSSRDSRDALGDQIGVSGRYIDMARKVIDVGEPELVKAVDDGHISVKEAAKLAGLPAETQKDAVKQAKQKSQPESNPKRKVGRPRIEHKDSQGSPIPKALLGVFTDDWRSDAAAEIASMTDRIRKLKSTAERKLDPAANLAVIVRTLDSSRADLEIVGAEIEQSRPYVICPKCGGSRCDECGQGWFTRDKFKEFKSKAKA